jgi:integrase
MSVYKQKGSKNWWYKFTWRGRQIRESTKQPNKRVAEQIEAAHKAGLAKAEVGIRDKKPVPTLREFIDNDFAPFVESRFASKAKTLEYYRIGLKNLREFEPLANSLLDAITGDKIAAFIAKRRQAGLAIASINRQLEVLRRMLKLAVEWGKVERLLPKVEMLSGENHRERVLSPDEENRYLAAASVQSFLLRDVTTILLDCALRPEECFRMRWEDVRDGALHILYGKTENARRTIPMTQRVAAQLDMRQTDATPEWVFPAPTATGHIEKSTLKKQHKKALAASKVEPFTLYTFRHTCLTRWAAFMDPYTLAYLAGHSDFSTTRRYVHPQADTIKAAIEKARGGHRIGHSESETAESVKPSAAKNSNDCNDMNGRGERIRTSGLLVPNQALYQAEPRPEENRIARSHPIQQHSAKTPSFVRSYP